MRYVLLSSCSGTVEVMQMMKLVWMVTVLVIAAPPDCAHGQTSEYQTKAERERKNPDRGLDNLCNCPTQMYLGYNHL